MHLMLFLFEVGGGGGGGGGVEWGEIQDFSLHIAKIFFLP